MYDVIKNHRPFAPAIFTRFFPSEGPVAMATGAAPTLLKAASIFLWVGTLFEEICRKVGLASLFWHQTGSDTSNFV